MNFPAHPIHKLPGQSAKASRRRGQIANEILDPQEALDFESRSPCLRSRGENVQGADQKDFKACSPERE
jgi:hypothetical protein